MGGQDGQTQQSGNNVQDTKQSIIYIVLSRFFSSKPINVFDTNVFSLNYSKTNTKSSTSSSSIPLLQVDHEVIINMVTYQTYVLKYHQQSGRYMAGILPILTISV